MKNQRELLELASRHGVKTTKRSFFERRDEKTGRYETTFMDLPRPRDEILAELREMGAMQ